MHVFNTLDTPSPQLTPSFLSVPRFSRLLFGLGPLLPAQYWRPFTSFTLAILRPWVRRFDGGTAAAAPPPFRPRNPALCGSRPLVTPYYCRLGDLLCFVFMYAYCAFLLIVCVICVSIQYFDTVGWVF